MALGVKLQQSRRRTRTYDRQPLNLEEVLAAAEQAIDGKADREHDHTADDITDATDTGKALLRAADSDVGRTILGVESTVQLDARDAANRDRANHEGTQLAATISDFAAAAAAALAGDVIGRYNADFGDGSATSYAITHSLGSLDVSVEIYEKSTGATVYCDVVRTNTNVVTVGVSPAPATNALRIVVKK